jgi:hypothetical protein
VRRLSKNSPADPGLVYVICSKLNVTVTCVYELLAKNAYDFVPLIPVCYPRICVVMDPVGFFF